MSGFIGLIANLINNKIPDAYNEKIGRLQEGNFGSGVAASFVY
jgi:hypothetical protein